MSRNNRQEKQVEYDNPCAPIVKFSSWNAFDDGDDDEDMMDEQIFSTEFPGEHLNKSLSLEDLVQSFDQTINSCFPTEQTPTVDSTPNEVVPIGWSELISNLRTSLRHDLKLPQLAEKCEKVLPKISSEEFPPIDDVEDEEENPFDVHSVICSNDDFHLEPFLTAEQVISEIDFMLQDLTPDSGYCDDQSTLDPLDFPLRRLENSPQPTSTFQSLHQTIDELNQSIKSFSSILVEELALRDELEYEKETKNTFISLVVNIQNKRQQYQCEKRPSKRRSIFPINQTVEAGTYLTTVIPFDPEHPTYLSVEHLQSLNKILRAIHDDSAQVPELLTNYILKVLCPC